VNEFDIKASGWDQNPMHWDRSLAVASQIRELIPLTKQMKALEFGAGTGITGFLLKDYLKEITLMDTSLEMLRVINGKIESAGADNLNTLYFDLEKADLKETTFDLIFNQMVLHHITDTAEIISKFYNILNPGGFLAIADLFPEDGSFHGKEFTGHKGFDPEELSKLLIKAGFTNISYSKCFVIEKKISDSETKQFDLFLILAQRAVIK
jgi:ubiquinone/menaquinone biosynthesis C-methylase UbiE